MKILVTGADGFTGKHFCAYSHNLGHEIYKLKSNILDFNSLNNEIKSINPDAIVHLAAISFVGETDKLSFYDVNVIGTVNVLEAIKNNLKKPRIIIASSANVYGNCAIESIDENVKPHPINHYAMSKLSMEYMSHTYMQDLDIIITRPFNYTGVGQNENFIIPKLVSHFKNKKSDILLGNIDVKREFNDVSLVCRYYLGLIYHGVAGETYNVCSGNVYSLKEIINLLKNLTNHHINIKTDNNLIRKNELKILKGNPKKIRSLMQKYPYHIDDIPLDSTLMKMIDT